MGLTSVMKERSLPQASSTPRPAASGWAISCPANAVDVEAPETGRLALHGHG